MDGNFEEHKFGRFRDMFGGEKRRFLLLLVSGRCRSGGFEEFSFLSTLYLEKWWKKLTESDQT